MKEDRPRILFIGTLPPPVHGSSVVSQQIKDSKLINDTFDCCWVNLSTSRRMDEIGKATLAKPFRLIGALCKVFLLLLTRKFDLCYLAITCHGIGFLKDSPFILICKLFGKKIVIHQHNKGMANDVGRWPYRWLLPLCYKNAKVILLSWYLYPDIEKVVKKEDVCICPNGIKVESLGVQETKSSSDNNIVSRILFLSNLNESKGVLVLLDALTMLREKGITFFCDIVGGETKEIDSKRLNFEIGKRNLKGYVIYHGKKFGVDKQKQFYNCDIFVHPTMNDCFPLVLLEAMEHHLPIVATPIGGIPDIVKNGNNGLIAELKNPQSLAECIEKLLTDEDLRNKMGEIGYKMLLSHYSEETFEKNVKVILEEIMEERI